MSITTSLLGCRAMKLSVRTGWIALFAVLPFTVYGGDASHWFSDLDLTLLHDDNVGLAQFRRDIVADNRFNASLALGFNHVLDAQHAITGKVMIEQARYHELEELAWRDIGVEGHFRWQPRFGFSAPFYSLLVRVSDRRSAVVQRDLEQALVQAYRSQRFSDRLTLTVGAEYRRDHAEHETFDGEQSRLFLNADYTLTDRWTGYAMVSVAEGDVTTSVQYHLCDGTMVDSADALLAAAKVYEPDQAFVAQFCGDWYAYRLHAKTASVVLGFNRMMDERSSWDMAAVYAKSAASDDDVQALDYQRTQWRLSYLRRF